MTTDELFGYCCQYLVDRLTFEERRSMGIEAFRKYVREHIIPIPKSNLVPGSTYNGYCRNSTKATWDGELFHYKQYKFGSWREDTIHHYEDDNDNSIDVFVPIKEI